MDEINEWVDERMKKWKNEWLEGLMVDECVSEWPGE